MKKTVKFISLLLVLLLALAGFAACAHKEASDHTPTGDWLSDATHHWHACEKEDCADAGDRAEHTYTNACDTTCDVCGYARTVGAHVYDNACDTTCNVCGATREITHAHSTTLTADETTHYYLCSVCGDKKDEGAHVFDKTTASSEYLKAAATATTKAQYYKSCVCGKASATEYFETDKETGTLANIQDLSKTYDKVELVNPTYDTNSDGAVTIEWYQGDTKLDAKPVNAGTYKVKVIIAESASYTGISVEKEFTIAKKVLSNLSVDLTYDGTNSFEVPLGAANGILAGDVADGIKVCITFANKNVGALVTGAGLDAEDGNNFANYELDLTTCTANIVKKVLSNLTVDLPYAGTNYFEVPLGVVNGIVADDVADGIKVCINFANKNVGALVTGASLNAEDGNNYTNYELDLNTCTASIVKKVLNNVTYNFTYNDSDYQQVVLTSADLSGIIGSDQVTLEVCFEDTIVGSAVDTSSPEMAPTFNDDNYELGTYSFSIVPKKLTLKAGETLSLSMDYRKTSSFAVTIDTSKLEGYVGTAAQMTVTATTSSDRAGTYDTGVILTPYIGHSSVKESQNYDFSEITTAKMKINKAELVLRSYVTVVYNGTNNFTLTNYLLTSSNTGDGQGCSVYNGDVVYLDSFEVGAPDVTDETFAINHTLSGEDAENYYFSELGVEITPKVINSYAVVNDISSYTKVADGTNIFTFTLTEAYGIVAGDVVVLNLPLYADMYCEVEITAQGTYTDVYCKGATLTGADASNYILNGDEPEMGQGYEATITAANP